MVFALRCLFWWGKWKAEIEFLDKKANDAHLRVPILFKKCVWAFEAYKATVIILALSGKQRTNCNLGQFFGGGGACYETNWMWLWQVHANSTKVIKSYIREVETMQGMFWVFRNVDLFSVCDITVPSVTFCYICSPESCFLAGSSWYRV